MKKTLIALAAVAVSSAAMAQVTLSGVVAARYDSDKTSATVTNKGFRINDAQVNFTATEDLGGGLKATARYSIDGATFDGSDMKGDGVDLTLSGGFGAVAFSGRDASDYLPLDLITDSNLFNGTVDQRLTYQSPTMSGLRFTATLAQGSNTQVQSATNELKLYELDYTAGPLTANVGMMNVDKATHTAFDGGTRFKVGYNFGVAAVSYGVMNTEDADGLKDKTSALSVSVPMGAVTLGYAYASHTDASVSATARTGTQISASYALSKRTSLSFSLDSYESATYASAKRTRFGLGHSF